LDQSASYDWPRAVARARAARAHAGYLLDDISEVALMVNVADPTFSVVGASAGYRQLSGFATDDVLGRAAVDVLTWGAPQHAVSRSANKNAHDFCRMCRDAKVEDIAQTAIVQPCAGKDGAKHSVLSLFGFIEVLRKPYVMIVQEPLGDGLLVRVTAERREELTEQCRQAFRRIRRKLQSKTFISNSSDMGGGSVGSEAESMCSVNSERYVAKRTHWSLRGHRRESILQDPPFALPDFAFFRERLQERCILSSDSISASRRELHELQNGCLVFSDRPVRRCATGLHFELRLDKVTNAFEGLPLLGFTRRAPADDGGLYPTVATCLGASVLVGTGYKAYARNQDEHFKMGFKLPPQHEVQTWELSENALARAKGRKLCVGDRVACTYTVLGRIQFWLNQEKILDFDTGRPIENGVDYYAVVDVCFSVGTVTLLPTPDDVTLELEHNEERVNLKQVVQPLHSVKPPRSHACSQTPLFSDTKAPLAPLLSLGDLSTIEFNGNNPSSASSCSCLSLESDDMPEEEEENLAALQDLEEQADSFDDDLPCGAEAEVEDDDDVEVNEFLKAVGFLGAAAAPKTSAQPIDDARMQTSSLPIDEVSGFSRKAVSFLSPTASPVTSSQPIDDARVQTSSVPIDEVTRLTSKAVSFLDAHEAASVTSSGPSDEASSCELDSAPPCLMHSKAAGLLVCALAAAGVALAVCRSRR